MIMRQNLTHTNFVLTEIQQPINQNAFSANLMQTSSERECSFRVEEYQDNRDDVESYDISSVRDEEKENYAEPDERDDIFQFRAEEYQDTRDDIKSYDISSVREEEKQENYTEPDERDSNFNKYVINQNGEGQRKVINQEYKYENTNSFNYLLNNYVKIGSNSRSGFGSKFHAAVDSETLSVVSLKEIQVHQGNGWKELESEILFLKSQSQLNCDHNCKNIINYHGAFYSKNRTSISIVTDYVRFGSLQHWIEHGPKHFFSQNLVHKYNQSPSIFSEKLEMFNWLSSIGNDILNGLCCLHSKYRMVHLDIKPENILITDDGRALISGFGSSKKLTLGELPYDQEDIDDLPTSSIIFMSPERLQQQQFCGIKSDVWSLGMTLLACAFGKDLMDFEDLIWTIPTCNGNIEHCLQDIDLPNDMLDFLGKCFRAEKSRPRSYNLVPDNFFARSHLWGDLEWQQMKTWWPRQSNISGQDLRNVHDELKKHSGKEPMK